MLEVFQMQIGGTRENCIGTLQHASADLLQDHTNNKVRRNENWHECYQYSLNLSKVKLPTLNACVKLPHFDVSSIGVRLPNVVA